MVIGNVNMQGMSGMMPPKWGEDYKLSDGQKTQLQEIISGYDPDNMTEEDKKSMMDEIREAGIRPGEDLKSILDEAGFDLKPPEGKQPPPMPRNSQTEDAPEFFTDFLEKLSAGVLTENDIDTFIESIKTQGEKLKGYLINQTA